MKVPTLKNLVFEPLKESDFPLLHTWLNAPHVTEWWDGAKSIEEVHAKYSEKINSDWQHAYIVSVEGKPFGYIQSYIASKAGDAWWPEESDATRGIDQFVGELSFMGRGYGTSMVREYSNWLLSLSGVEKIITDPKPTNERAIRCYRAAGFTDVGLIDTPSGNIFLMKKT